MPQIKHNQHKMSSQKINWKRPSNRLLKMVSQPVVLVEVKQKPVEKDVVEAEEEVEEAEEVPRV